MPSTNYTSTADFKTYASIVSSSTSDDVVIGAITQAVFSTINQYCGRDFSTSTGSRIFEACVNTFALQVDDISSAVGVTVSHDTANDGTYDTTWASTDYELRPLNGRLNGSPWPYTEIRAVGNNTFPVALLRSDRAHVQVSATWGWPAVPADVTQASLVLAMDLFKTKEAPFGIAGTTEFGNIRISPTVAGIARMLLAPYRRTGVIV